MTFAAVMMLQAAVAWQVGPGDVTVGDTVVVEREVLVVDPAANILLGALEPSDLVEPLRAPEVLRTADGFIARYTLAVFEPGEHTIPMPDVELEYPGGRRETLLGGAAFVTVMSVLPSGDSLPLPPPRGPRIPVVRTITRTLPTALLVASVLVATVVWGVARRRSQPRPAWERADGAGAGAGVAAGAHDPPPIMRWIAAGEHRAVATVTMHRVRDRVAQLVPQAGQSLHIGEWLNVLRTHRPRWPLRELGDVMRALERASFAPAIPSDVIALADEAEVLAQSLDSKREEQG